MTDSFHLILCRNALDLRAVILVDSIFTATARLIANRASFKLKFARLHKLVEDLRIVLNEEDK